jgi:hypothetical protein
MMAERTRSVNQEENAVEEERTARAVGMRWTIAQDLAATQSKIPTGCLHIGVIVRRRLARPHPALTIYS